MPRMAPGPARAAPVFYFPHPLGANVLGPEPASCWKINVPSEPPLRPAPALSIH